MSNVINWLRGNGWFLLMIGAGFTYMANMPNPSTWTWAQWMQTCAATALGVAGWLKQAPNFTRSNGNA